MSDPFKVGLRPHINTNKRAATDLMNPLFGSVSGEITGAPGQTPTGISRAAGKVRRVLLSVGASGKDDSNDLSIAGDVFINGVSCLSTNPDIAHVSGEASQQKTTAVTGDTGITQSVINQSANTFNPGDVFTHSFTITRIASPTTEISNPVIMIEFEPDK